VDDITMAGSAIAIRDSLQDTCVHEISDNGALQVINEKPTILFIPCESNPPERPDRVRSKDNGKD